MKEITTRLSTSTQRDLMGIYIFSGLNGYTPLVPSNEPLTVANFGIILNGMLYTADDFEWYKKDGSDRDFSYRDRNGVYDGYLKSNDLPIEVSRFLNAIICAKFAKQQLLNARTALIGTSNNVTKQIIKDAIASFEKLDDIDDTMKKLLIAKDDLFEVYHAFKNVNNDFYTHFYDAFFVVSDIIYALVDTSKF